MNIIYAISGQNIINGTNGNDIIIVDVNETFTIDAKAGNDTIIIKQGGNHIVSGRTGNDRFYVFGGGTPELYGDEGNNEFVMKGSNGWIVFGGGGINTFISDGYSNLALGSGTRPGGSGGTPSLDIWNILNGGNYSRADRASNVIVNGDSRNNTFTTGSGNDTLNGGAGNDTLNGGFGYDTFNGGVGIDTVIYSYYSGGIVANLNTAIVTFRVPNDTGTETLNLIENIVGSRGDDILFGDLKNNTLNGGTGQDVLAGGSGSDILLGSFGNDTINGGAGNDLLVGGAGFDRIVYNTNLPFSARTVGRDRITGFVKNVDKIVLDKTTFRGLRSPAGVGFSINSEFATVRSDAQAARSRALT